MIVNEILKDVQLPKLALSREEAAEVLGISTASIDRLVKRGFLHPNRATRRVIFAQTELARFLNETTSG